VGHSLLISLNLDLSGCNGDAACTERCVELVMLAKGTATKIT